MYLVCDKELPSPHLRLSTGMEPRAARGDILAVSLGLGQSGWKHKFLGAYTQTPAKNASQVVLVSIPVCPLGNTLPSCWKHPCAYRV